MGKCKLCQVAKCSDSDFDCSCDCHLGEPEA